VVGANLSTDGQAAVKAGAERIVVIGGDGTLIGVARSLHTQQIPLIGVNMGKLGFLTEFSVEEVQAHFERALRDFSLIARRTMLEASVHGNGEARVCCLAVNDCVIQAGPPFRMIRLGVAINREHFTDVRGDGLIVCTPAGSTAHSLSAGGPIMQAGVDAIVLTPLNPHSLTHRPLVIERQAVIDITASQVNEGTTIIIDGQVSYPLQRGDRVTIRRFDTDMLVVRNPIYARWHKLVTKMHWGQGPELD
jgi:NAD+ kinase